VSKKELLKLLDEVDDDDEEILKPIPEKTIPEKTIPEKPKLTREVKPPIPGRKIIFI
jgi:hypothetical protein